MVEGSQLNEEPTGPLHDFFNRPLGGFALIGVWCGFIEIVCVCCAFQSKDLLSKCEPLAGNPLTQVGIWNWLMISAGGALMHVLFAPYVHLQLWRSLIVESKEVDDPSKGISRRTKEARTPGGAIRASKHDVLEAFKDTFRRDPIIYFYAFVLVLDFVWSVVGLTWIHSNGVDCNPRGWTLRTAYAAAFFDFFVIGYSAAWYFYMNSMEGDDVLTLRSADPSALLPAYQTPGKAAQATSHAKVEELEQGGGGLLSCCAGGSAPSKDSGVKALASNKKEPEKPKLQRKPSVVLAMPKLMACVLLDALGNATYFFPGIGEIGDALFAPASAVMMKMLFERNGIAVINGTEEILPGTDIMPTATVAWMLQTLMPNSYLTRMLGLNKYD